MEAILAFGAALLTFRLAGLLAARWRAQRQPYLLAWTAGLAAYALGAAAIAAGAAAGWNEGSFRAYYLFGGLLTAALLGTGSLLLAGVRIAGPVALVYVGLAVGVALAVPLESPIAGSSIPEAQEHLAFYPARILAIVGNVAGSLALIVVVDQRLPAPPGRQRAAPRRLRHGRRRKRARRARRSRDRCVHRRRCRTFVCGDDELALTVLTLCKQDNC